MNWTDCEFLSSIVNRFIFLHGRVLGRRDPVRRVIETANGSHDLVVCIFQWKPKVVAQVLRVQDGQVLESNVRIQIGH
ncbi:hypothetical protein PsorP6_014808 [Peronosclerospora sorghi]|uniref:Uncharacterized protein n=1 Tax=Peronosclerospora sorghi TaxID=230839 RepID=A0ACC0VSJ3_9STRA|nr:hypothetical protein PsorP6_014808 [Peronosclerospora sorghi]